MKRQRQTRPEEKSWIVEGIGIAVMLACVVMLIAAAHAGPVGKARSHARFGYNGSGISCDVGARLG
jgi:hypothetical protein